MKRIERDGYEVMRLDGNGGLCVSHYTQDDSLEGARYAIDVANRTAVDQGYKAEQFLIVFDEFYKWVEDDGRFIKSESLKTAVEVYPAEL